MPWRASSLVDEKWTAFDMLVTLQAVQTSAFRVLPRVSEPLYRTSLTGYMTHDSSAIRSQDLGICPEDLKETLTDVRLIGVRDDMRV